MENKATIAAAHLDLAHARKEAAHRITWRNTLYSAGVGLLPFPLIDAAIFLALQLHMLRSLARLYRVDFRKNLAQSLIGSLAGYAGAAGLIKALPGLGSLLGGATTAVAAAASTYATGKILPIILTRAVRCWISTRSSQGSFSSGNSRMGQGWWLLIGTRWKKKSGKKSKAFLQFCLPAGSSSKRKSNGRS